MKAYGKSADDTTTTARFAALADPTRREIFERVAQRPRSVAQLAEGLPVSRPAVSQHLRVLKAAGLVSDVTAGSRRIYSVDPTGVGALRAYLDGFWSNALAAFKTAVEQADPMTTSNTAVEQQETP